MSGTLRPALAALAAAIALGACTRGHEGSEDLVCADDRTPCLSDDDCGAGVACVSANTPTRTVLQPLGFLTQRVFPGAAVTLQVVALRSTGADIDEAGDLVPLVAEVVRWSIVGSASDASLASDATLTDAQGASSVVLDSGAIDGVSFQVRAEIEDAPAVTFSVQVREDVRELTLLSPASIASAVDRNERLRVQVLRPTGGGGGVPVANVRLQVELVGGARDGARLEPDPGSVAEITTDLAGIAGVRFRTGSAVGSYELIFCPAGNTVCPDLAPELVTVAVAARDNGGPCQYFTDCAPGYVCTDGACELGTAYCDGDGNCPPGYHCGAGRQCELGAGDVCSGDPDCGPGETCGGSNTCVQGCIDDGDCGAGQRCGGASTCIDDGGCTSQPDCPVGWLCDLESGACIPDPTPDVPVVDVSGEWRTRYHFDLTDALPGFFRDGLLPVVDFLNLVFQSQLDIDIPVLGDILEGFLDQLVARYVPPWVRTVASVLGDFLHLFEDVEIDGVMTLYQPGSPVGYAVSGEEEWTDARFFVASLCPGGLPQFELDPTCGQVDVVLDSRLALSFSNNDPDVGVVVRPFSGQVEPPSSGAGPSWVHLYDRRADIALSQLLNVLLDVVVAKASGGQWYDFEDFLRDVIPCTELRYAVEDLACDITDGSVCSLPAVETLCDAAAATAVAGLTAALGDVGLQVLQMGFDQSAAIQDDGNAAAPRAVLLGDPLDPAPNSAIVGTTEVLSIFDGNFDARSWWYGAP